MQKFTLDILNEDRLHKVVDQETFLLGLKLYQEGHTLLHQLTETLAVCVVWDKRNHRVEMRLTQSHLYLKCDCAHASRGLVCEHGVASWLFLRDHLKENVFPMWRSQVSRMIDSAQSSSAEKSTAPYLLFFSLVPNQNLDYTQYRWNPVIFPLYAVTKEIRQNAAAWQPADIPSALQGDPFLSAKLRIPYAALKPEGCANQSREAVVLANVMIEQARSFSGGMLLDDYLTFLAQTDGWIFLGDDTRPLDKLLRINSEPGQLRLKLHRDSRGILIQPCITIGEAQESVPHDEFRWLYPSQTWGLAGDLLFPLANPEAFLALGELAKDQDLLIPEKQEKDFLELYYYDLAKQFPIEGENVVWEEIDTPPVPRLYLSDNSGELQAQLRFGYGDFEVTYDSNFPEISTAHPQGTWRLVRIYRQREPEEAASKKLASTGYGLKRSPLAPQPGIFCLRTRYHPVDFLLHQVPRLVKEGFEIYGEEQLKTARVNRSTPSISFAVSSGIDWFDIQAVVNFGELEVSLKDIRKSLRKRERFIKLADGSIGEIPESWLEKYKYLLGLAETSEKGFRLSQHHLSLIEQILSDAELKQTDAVYDSRREVFKALSQPEYRGIPSLPLPAGFNGELRPYQKSGYDWLHFLRQYGFGGCLADDMGLGKTVQALVFLQSLYEDQGQRPRPQGASLLVVPRSLLVNWQRESARFTPNLKMLEYFSADRAKDFSTFDQVDVVITTYGVLLRDIGYLHGYTFDCAILDESQAIKNPLSQTARAARLLQARHKLVLTGTPIENSTSELWSQFSFLNPGLLGSLEYFKTEFGSPIERKNDDRALGLLRKLVYPFILRRTKDQVAPELPPRTERILYCDMEPAQRKLYNRTRDTYRGLMLGLLDQGGLGQNSLRILEGLLRLRQISNHPNLFDPKFRGDSGKFALLLDTLETLQAEGHKALVFSQFVQMLSLVRKDLDSRKIPYTYLDGQTQDRQAQVDTFQTSPNIPFFLISLKAGGQGLNLTAADYVIHIDPWWNPAVEMQASDRTHRIGQDKPVFVFKLITRDSVEEKILTLQERKKTLVDQVITNESAFFKSLSAEDLKVLFS